MLKKRTASTAVCQPTAAARPGIFKRIARELSENKCLYIMALPAIAYYLIFCYGPMYGMLIAFKDFQISKGMMASPWVGFKHFEAFFNSMYCWRLIRNTLLLSFYDILIGFPAPIIFALLLNEIRCNPFKRTVQTITYIPHFVSVVVVCGMLLDFFSESGILTACIAFFGGDVKNYLGDPNAFRSIYIGSNVWQQIGWNSIIYLSALSGINSELYEAASLDGAGRLRQTVHVTIPGILPTIVVMLIMKIGSIMGMGYEKVILLYNAQTYETADIIASFVYRRGLEQGAQYSYTAAIGLFQSVINLALLLSSNWFSKKFTDSGLF